MYSSLFRAVLGFVMFIAGSGFIPAYYILRMSPKKFSKVNWLGKYNDHFIVTYPLVQLFVLFILFVSGLWREVWSYFVFLEGWDELLLFSAAIWGFTSLFFLLPRLRQSPRRVVWHNLVYLFLLTGMISVMASPAFLKSSGFILSYFGALVFSIALYFNAAMVVIIASWIIKKLSHRLNHARLT